MAADPERLTALFTRAIELGSEARAALIDRVRADDDALASELAALLRADAVAATELGTGVLAHAASPTVHGGGPARAASATVRDGGRGRGAPRERLSIPGYRVEGLLGEGGMGAVYAGEQESPPRPVAIKVLHVASGPALARFWTEAAIMARLDHPGIARVLESGEAEGHPYIVMERVEGATLDAHVRATGAPLRRRLELFAAVCDAVHHAHVNGVIHRDLKPANVMVRGDGRIAVLDFGIARTAALDGASSGQTRAGELIGTPIYMSPEQARLRPDEVDARSDVYSLGVTLYELVSGELPYDVRELPLPAVSLVICEDPPRPLRARGHDRDLDAIAGQALAKAPRDRYQSAAALADDVRRYLDGRAVSVRVPGALEQLRRFVRQRPALAAALAGAVAAAIAFTVVVTRLWLSARAAEHVAAEARGRAEGALAELAARTADLTLQQARAVVARDPAAALALVDELRASGAEVPAGAWALDAVAAEARGRGAATHVLRGHADEVRWVEPLGGGALVTASHDGTVRAWRPPYAEGELVFRAARGRVHVARPSPDGARIAIGGDDGAAHVVDRAGGRPVALPGHAGEVESVAWSADGAWLVTGDDGGGLIAWPRGAPPGRRLAAGGASIEAVAFGADGRALVAGDEAGAVWRWDLTSWARVELTAGGGAAVRALWAGGDRVAAATADGAVRRWRAADGAPIADVAATTRVPAKRAAFADGGAACVLAGNDGTIVRVDGLEIAVLGAHAAKVRGLAISPDGRRIATGSEDGGIRVWDGATGRRFALRGHAERIRHLAFAGGGGVLLSADGAGAVRRWAPGEIPATSFHDHGAAIERVALSADAGAALTVDADGVAYVSDLASGASHRIGASPAHVTAIALAGRAAITGDVDGAVTWWRAPGAPRRAVAGAVRAIAASPGGDVVAVATAAGPIALFSGDGAPLASLAGHAGGTDAVAFDPGGALLASGGQDRELRVWRVAGPGAAGAAGAPRAPSSPIAPIAELGGLTDDAALVRFSPRGDLLVAATDDGVVRAWDVRGGAIDPAPARIVAEHAAAVTALAFDRGGRYLAAAGRDAWITRTELATGARVRIEARHRGALGLAVDERGRVLIAREGGALERWAPPASPSAIPLSAITTSAIPLPTGDLLIGGLDGALRVIRAP